MEENGGNLEEVEKAIDKVAGIGEIDEKLVE